MSLFAARDDELLHTRKWSDKDRCAFLQNLDEADVEISDFEARFLESNLARLATAPDDYVPFTSKQRSVIEQLYTKYNEHIG